MHPELLALLDAVRAAPADDLRRLVLADWLDEHAGTPADRGRADLIRVQLELVRRPATDPDRPLLQAREKELIEEHATAWGKGLPPRRTNDLTGDRGFVVERGLLRLWFLRGQRWLSEAVSGHPAWAWVDGVTLLDASVEELAEVAASPALRRLNFLCVATDGWINWTGGVAPGPAGARLIAESEHAQGLTELVLSDCVIGPKGAEALAGSPHLRGLIHLDLNGVDCTDANLIQDEGVRALAASPYLTRLERLDLPECVITAVGAATLATAPNFHHLTRLNLAGNPLGAAGVRALAESPHLTRLTRLFANANPLRLRPQESEVEAAAAEDLLRQRFGAVWDPRWDGLK